MIHEFHKSHDKVHVAGDSLKSIRDYYTNCGIEMTEFISKMILKGNYTGPFCVDYKSNSNHELRYFEVNPRLCGRVPYYKHLFVASFIPLLFASHYQAVPFANKKSKVSSIQHHSTHRNLISPTPDSKERHNQIRYYEKSHPLNEKLLQIVKEERRNYLQQIENKIPFDINVEINWKSSF